MTFNVVYTRGSVARLLPFALSLLQSPGIRIRLVSNGCESAEVELIRAVAEREDCVSHHVLPFARTAEHGAALNALFETFADERFAFVDSDVIASGDFVAPLRRVLTGQAGVFTALPVYIADGETEQHTAGRFVLSGGRRTLDDGTYIGNTYCAIYERDALETVWRKTPRGFAVHHDYLLPKGVKASLAERGWLYRSYDTARLVNLQLLLAGFTLEERSVPELHHVGGTSIRDYFGPVGLLRRLEALLSGSGGRVRRVADGARTYVRFKLQRDPTLVRRRRRKYQVLAHLDETLDALTAGRPVPPAPRTDSERVDRRLAELVAVLETEYPRGLARLGESTDAMINGSPPH